MTVLIALGGNAMTGPDGRARPEDQRTAIGIAAESVADIVAAGTPVVLTHGNGPQVGNLLVKNEIAASVVPPVPLDWCGAQTQGTIGMLLLNALDAALASRNVASHTAVLVSRTLVSADDPGFANPTKPIGRYLADSAAAELIAHGQVWRDFGARGWRRVVASPEPLANLDAAAAMTLLAAGFVVVCAGGGGIPVVRDADGSIRGVEAVIDKDLTAAVLASQIGVTTLIIATDVDAVVSGWGTAEARAVSLIGVAAMRVLADSEHFPAGSMGPKVEAACRFAESGGRAIITSLQHIGDALAGNAGTVVVPDPGRVVRTRVADPGGRSVPEPIEVRKIPLHHVSDASELAGLIDAGVLAADRVVAVIGKTEGNGGVNDYTRILADRAFREVLVAKGSRGPDAVARVPIVWSGGTDGVISPHATVFATVPAGQAELTDEPRLSIGFAMSERLVPEDIGRTAMITKVAAAVRSAMAEAGISDPADVHYVQTKTPLLTIHTISDAKSRGQTVWTENTGESMDVSNGCAALGIAVALGEIAMPADADVMRDRGLSSSVASCSSGVELDRAQVVVAGNVRGIGGRYSIGHSVMRDALDADGIWAAIRSAGLDLPDRPHPTDLDGRLVNVFLKCEASQDGTVRGRRNAMLDDSDVHWHRQIKACVGGVASAVTGDPAVFVSVSAAHQGPDGGGPVAAIVDLGPRRVA